MKFTVEYEKEEYTSLVDMVNKMTDVVGKAIQYVHLERMERIKNQRLKTVGSMFDSMDDDIDEELEDSILNVIKGGKEDSGPFGSTEEPSTPTVEEPTSEEMNTFAQRGKVVFEELVELWIQGFDIADAEQPPRGERCRELTQSFDGRAVIHYMEHVKSKYISGGLTYAIRDSGLVPQNQVRLMAENMTAVSSACRFTQLASYLEHPDPSQLEDFFNV